MTTSDTAYWSTDIDSTYISVRTCLEEIDLVLDGVLCEQQKLAAELCLAESLNNIVEHAYAEDGSGTITIDIYIEKNEICFVLSDFGKSIPDQVLSEARANPNQPSDLSDGGYGLSLIQKLATRIDYKKNNKLNSLRLWMKKNESLI